MRSARNIAEDCLSFHKRPRWDPDQTAGLQNRRLRRIVVHAAQTVPFYRRAFSMVGLDPRDIRGSQDLSLLPVASRDELRAATSSERVSESFDPNRLVRHMTSGSTGEPMAVLRTRIEEALVHGYQLRAQLVSGVPLMARRAKVGKSFCPSVPHRLGLLPTLPLDPITSSPESVLAALRRWRADCIDVRPGVLESLLDAAEREGRDDWPWQWIVCGGEVLYPDLQARAERVFRAQVLERYAAHEVGLIAFRCVHCDFYHTSDDSVIVEIVKDGRPAQPGERGDILVTSLLSFAQPVLRFPLGDLVVQGSPSCDATCPIGFGSIGTIEGRRLDNLALTDGRSMPSYELMAALRETSHVKQFQVLQRSAEAIHILYVPDPLATVLPGPELERRLSQALPIPMTITSERVAKIESTESGKRRYIRSLPATARAAQV